MCAASPNWTCTYFSLLTLVLFQMNLNRHDISEGFNQTIIHVREMAIILHSTYLTLQLSSKWRCHRCHVQTGCFGTNYNKMDTSLGILESRVENNSRDWNHLIVFYLVRCVSVRIYFEVNLAKNWTKTGCQIIFSVLNVSYKPVWIYLNIFSTKYIINDVSVKSTSVKLYTSLLSPAFSYYTVLNWPI